MSASPEMPEFVVVTGGAGFIGCALSQVLAPRSKRFLAIDNLHPQVHRERRRPRRLHEAAELRVADVTQSETWEDALSGATPDVVIHLAAETGTAQSLEEATRHAQVNVVGTTQMLDAMHRLHKLPEQIVLSSSRAVYGEGQWLDTDGRTFYPGQRSHEQLSAGQWDFPGSSPIESDAATTAPNPTSVYGATKLAQENIVKAWCLSHSTRCSILRLQNVFGPGQSKTNAYTGIVVLFAQMARDGKPIPLYEDGEVTRDFVYVDDVVSAIVASLRTDTGQHPLDVGSGTATSINLLAERISALYESPAPVVTGQFRDGDVRHAQCSIERTQAVLGWSPVWSLERGLQSLRDWLESGD